MTQALDRAFDGGLLHIDALQGRPGGKFTIERFVQYTTITTPVSNAIPNNAM